MSDVKTATLGFLSALATIGVDRLNVWIALAIGAISLALLLRRAIGTFLGDFRAWRSGRGLTLPVDSDRSDKPKDEPRDPV